MSTDTHAQPQEHKRSMDKMYRLTRHVYDASRKYYLLGRDKMITQLKPADGEHVIEVGCGTARNLIKLAKRYPNAHFYGIDISDEMLKTARKSLEKKGVADKVMLAQGFAQSFSAEDTFGLTEPPEKIMFSYALSIIPPWKESIDHALDILPDGGELHIVDFGAMHGQPKLFRSFIFWWLKVFHVYHKPEILEHLKTLEEAGHGALAVSDLYKGYAYIAVFKKLS